MSDSSRACPHHRSNREAPARSAANAVHASFDAGPDLPFTLNMARLARQVEKLPFYQLSRRFARPEWAFRGTPRAIPALRGRSWGAPRAVPDAPEAIPGARDGRPPAPPARLRALPARTRRAPRPCTACAASAKPSCNAAAWKRTSIHRKKRRRRCLLGGRSGRGQKRNRRHFGCQLLSPVALGDEEESE